MEGTLDKGNLTNTCHSLLMCIKALCDVVNQKNEEQFVSIARSTAITTVALGKAIANFPLTFCRRVLRDLLRGEGYIFRSEELDTHQVRAPEGHW